MASQFPRSPEIRSANPVFTDNRLKLGVFGINRVGLAMTNLPGTLVPTWEASLEIGRLADRAGFEAIVPVSRWKSHVPGKPGHRSSQALETFTWAAAMVVSTRRAAVFATCHVAAFPPVLAAKQAATLDQISGGRFGLNVVAGWNTMEPGMLGAKMLQEHERRYGQAIEWMEIVQRVWTSEDEFDYHASTTTSRAPTPSQAGAAAVAGRHERRPVGARPCVLGEVLRHGVRGLGGDDPAAAAETVTTYRAYAHERAGRAVGVWPHGYVVHGDTDEAAHAMADEMYAQGDFESADVFIAGVGATNSGLPEEVHQLMSRQMVLGSGGFPLVGWAETIADRLAMLSVAPSTGCSSPGTTTRQESVGSPRRSSRCSRSGGSVPRTPRR
jgi:alkanesulfonate monooxygenase SsuD/methylene tetrahydromethanopterin reductase-like flavin-dependent oxidoreductase (luciferase family)